MHPFSNSNRTFRDIDLLRQNRQTYRPHFANRGLHQAQHNIKIVNHQVQHDIDIKGPQREHAQPMRFEKHRPI